jgi:hypothetical protein
MPYIKILMLQRFSKKINIFFNLSNKFKCLFFINFFLCGIARAAIKCLSLKQLSRYFGMPYKNICLSTVISQKELARAITLRRTIKLAAKYTPWHSNCLTQALVAKFWCQWLNIPYALYIGFAKDKAKPEGYAAHAWVTAGPIAITGQYSFSKFQVISSYVSQDILENFDN